MPDMPTYDTTQFDPPAPVARVSFVNPANDMIVEGVSMLLDTGADVSIVPEPVLLALHAEKLAASYEIEYLESAAPDTLAATHLQMQWLGLKFTGSFLVTAASYGVVGRNILNRVVLVLDGPAQRWDIR